jgi:hypothetical protein
MFDNEWLQKLKVGDQVIVEAPSLNFGGGNDLGTVVRITKNFIVVTRGSLYEYKYRRDDGRQVGNDRSWNKSCLSEATPEALAKFEEERYRQVFQNKLEHISWADVPLDRIKQIRELVEPYVKRKETK